MSPAGILHEYLTALKRDSKKWKPEHKLTPMSPLFYRGNPAENNVKSYFQAQPMGSNYLKNVPRQIAEYLGLPNPERYTSHAVRHTSATIAAQNLATTAQLTVSKIMC